MNEAKDGGPAFPQHGWTSQPEVLERMRQAGLGMTLLDYFAARVLQGMMANPQFFDAVAKMKAEATGRGASPAEFERSFEFPMYANASYGIARAMLAEKAKGGAQ